MPPDPWLNKHWRTAQPELAERIDKLLTVAGGNQANAVLYRDMVRSILRMQQRDADRWDAKIMANSLREMEQGFARLAQFKHQRKVSVFGSARSQPGSPEYQLAKSVAAHLVLDDFMVITGAGPGIMEAANEGAGRDQSIGLNINLPFEQEANPVMRGALGLLEFRFFFIRKLFFVREADAVIVFPGGFGTMDESLELLTLVQTGKSPVIPIVLMDVPGKGYWDHWLRFVNEGLLEPGYIAPHDMSLFIRVDSAEAACQEIRQFYRNYHSYRWAEGHLRMRIARRISDEDLGRLNAEFGDLCASGGIEQTGAHEAERDEPELADFPRLSFRFNQRDCGRLRQLIDAVNLCSPP